jgi:hypothetical protein
VRHADHHIPLGGTMSDTCIICGHTWQIHSLGGCYGTNQSGKRCSCVNIKPLRFTPHRQIHLAMLNLKVKRIMFTFDEDVFIYIRISRNEYQFYRDGDSPTNYTIK